MTFVLVTGTSTGVGKTIATAAMAVALELEGLRVGVVKPVQTGVGGGEPSDADVVLRLSGVRNVVQLAMLTDPLAPDTAARLRGEPTPTVGELAEQIASFGRDADVVLVEGAGGVLVRLDTGGATLLDLGRRLAADGRPVTSVIVTTLALGTLNHTELTLRALADAGLAVAGLVMGSVPRDLGLAESCNRTELSRVTGLRSLGELPEGAGERSPDAFREAASTWFPSLREALGLRRRSV